MFLNWFVPAFCIQKSIVTIFSCIRPFKVVFHEHCSNKARKHIPVISLMLRNIISMICFAPSSYHAYGDHLLSLS